nr:MAG TPA: hypothetical protein [Caudoviricetes sp.]
MPINWLFSVYLLRGNIDSTLQRYSILYLKQIFRGLFYRIMYCIIWQMI